MIDIFLPCGPWDEIVAPVKRAQKQIMFYFKKWSQFILQMFKIQQQLDYLHVWQYEERTCLDLQIGLLCVFKFLVDSSFKSQPDVE